MSTNQVSQREIVGILRSSRVTAFSKELAKNIGVNEAIFLGQLEYWLLAKGRVIDGEYWYFSTYENWTNEFNLPFWSEKTVKRTVARLRDAGVIVTTSEYNKMPMDKTLWYCIPGWTPSGQPISQPETTCPDGRDKLTRREGQVDPMVGTTCPDGEGQPVPTNNHESNHKSTHKNNNTTGRADSPIESIEVDGRMIRNLLTTSGMMYFEGDFNRVVDNMVDAFGPNAVAKAAEETAKQHRAKITKGGRGITGPARYMSSILSSNAETEEPKKMKAVLLEEGA